MMGSGGAPGSSSSGLNSLYEVVSLLDDDSKYAAKIRELTAKLVEADTARQVASQNSQEAHATRNSANELLAQVDAKTKEVQKLREDHAIAAEALTQREQRLNSAQRQIDAERSAWENHKAKAEEDLAKKHEEHNHREAAVHLFEQNTHASMVALRKETESKCESILKQANAELEAAQKRREAAEARFVEAEKLRQHHEDRLNKLVSLASGK